jgi:hypothetical protein
MTATKPTVAIRLRFPFASSRQTCVLLFGVRDWKRCVRTVQAWRHAEWCNWEESQMVLSAIWGAIDKASMYT